MPIISNIEPISIGCESNDECRLDNSCVNKLCIDICKPGLCGENADCLTKENRPICECPIGTTGNPTVQCVAIATDKIVVHSPYTEQPTIIQEDPIHPIQFTTSTLPPLDFTTTFRPEESIIRPTLPAYVPEVVIACENNDECTTDNSCINKLCYNVCVLGICGDDAECKVDNHRPVCSCPPGTTGNPLYKCIALLTEISLIVHPHTETSPLSDYAAIIPIKDGPYLTQSPIGIVPTSRPSDAIIPPVHQPATAPPVPIGCESNNECSYQNSCINKLCMNICYKELCGDDAECFIENHKPKCLCPPGTTGNPTIKCTALATEKTFLKHPVPEYNEVQYINISPISAPADPTLSPIGESTVHAPDLVYDYVPIITMNPTLQAACMSNDDCDISSSCINLMCLSACSLQMCGSDSNCVSKNHRPICLCPPGTTGDPLDRCLSTEFAIPPSTKSPFIEEKEIFNGIIEPLRVPSVQHPDPIAHYPSPKPLDPIIADPILHIHDIPITVGCESNDECSFDNSCVNQICLNICNPGFCGENADCFTQTHRPQCICPPGTTGNPTIQCISVATDRVPSFDPISDVTYSPTDKPVVPTADSFTTHSPLAVLPTESIKDSYKGPPAVAIVPLFSIGCKNNDECTLDNSCINKYCYDVCKLGFCGQNSECMIHNHRPICVCPPGTTGDPSNECKSLVTDSPVLQSPVTEAPHQYDYIPIQPILGSVLSTESPIEVPFYHSPEKITKPPYILPTPSPVAIGCKTNDECSYQNMCVNKLCIVICYPGICGENADCQMHQHKPVCKCPQGTTGNPTIKCSALATERPYLLQPPLAETSKTFDDSIIIPQSVDSESTKSPIGVTSPVTPEVQLDYYPTLIPILPQSEIACSNNDDCDINDSCINKLCLDACTIGICGYNSDCQIFEHRPVCICPSGTTGDPQIKCTAVATHEHTVYPPVAEYTSSSPTVIKPTDLPSYKPPHPVADVPRPISDDPEYKNPSVVESFPNFIAGCESNDECPSENSCINKICFDICTPGFCGEYADCVTETHRPLCVCPPGTTGNPTIQCIAITTEKHFLIKPIGDPVIIDTGPSILPISGTVPEILPPISIQPEISPVEIVTRPPISPISPVFIIACESADDCTSDNSCINNLCYDVCALGVCGDSADCVISKHRPICLCPPGTTGNPLYECKSILTERPVQNDPPIGYINLLPAQDIIEPLKEVPSFSQSPIGIPSYEKVDDTSSTQTPPYPLTPPPISVGCKNNDDCSFESTCINRLCIDMCYPGLCGENANCKTASHRPVCVCPTGTTGNPTIKCSALATEKPDIKIPIGEQINDPLYNQIISISDPPQSTLSPISETTNREPEPIVQYPTPPTILTEIEIACANNDECEYSDSCINMICIKACSMGMCGTDANCITSKHRPVCICPIGTTGDPQVQCLAMDTTQYSTLKPIVDHNPIINDFIIPTQLKPADRPDPIADQPAPQSKDPEYYEPDYVPMPPTISVGCHSASNCPDDNSCVNQICLNICHPGLCGENAECTTKTNRAECVCPSGTTGNPTIKCIAVTTDKIPTAKPIGENVLILLDSPIIPIVGYTSTTSSPLADLPKPHPVEPVVRPPVIPIVSDYSIACHSQTECTSDFSCINNLCHDVCKLGICGEDANCLIDNHRPVCVCPPGTTGNPLYDCKSFLYDTSIILDPIKDDTKFPPENPIIPLAGETYSKKPPIGKPSYPKEIKQVVLDVPIPPTPPPVTVGCENNDGCSIDETCVNKLCMDICYQGLCGETADCVTDGHRPICLCPPGTTGNPTVKCSAMAIIEHTTYSPYSDTIQLTQSEFIVPILGETSQHPQAIAYTTAKPSLVPIIPSRDPPPIPKIEVACRNNDDCETDNSCINMMCLDTCSLGICGEDSNCILHNHRPICLCPPGTTGNPQIKCSSFMTERTTTKQPIVEEVLVHNEPISPSKIPSKDFPQPLGEIPILPPSDPATTSVASILLPVITSGCESNDDCSYDNSCVNKICLDICHPGFCGEHADCITHMNRPTCTCPPGTTGNPTIKCSAIIFETSTILPPIGYYPVKPPHTEIIADHSPPQPTESPIAQLPEPHPDDPPIIRPKPEPIIPQFTIACENNDECTTDNSCINNLCYDVCSLGVCASDAQCIIENHRPVCVCPPGTVGHPLNKCTSILTSRPETTPPISDDQRELIDHPIHPLPGSTSPSPIAVGIPSEKEPEKQPPVIIIPPTPPPVAVGCSSNTHCSVDSTCVNQLCLDMCYPGLCGEIADCETIQHRPVCTCPPGTTGNPTIKCSAMMSDQPYTQKPPISELQIPIQDDPLKPIHIPASTNLPPISISSKPIVELLPPVTAPPPIIPTVLIACSNNDDCDRDNSCINMNCYNACSLGICGEDSNCVTNEHRPVCLCPPGSTGNPQIKCTAYTAEIITTKSPITEQPIVLYDTIQAQHIPSPERPKPIGEEQTSPPKDPITSFPPFVPKPPPITVGCTTNQGCPYDQSCVNKLCLNICHQGLCGRNADCFTSEHRPTCQCPPGTSGNPTVGCKALMTEKTMLYPPLVGDTPVLSPITVIPDSITPTTIKPLVGKPNVVPFQPEYQRPKLPPLSPTITIACGNNDRCPEDNSCINNLCYDVCSLGVCSQDSECTVENHRPVCKCPTGTTGDPLYKCTAVQSEHIPILPPISADGTPVSTDPISPVFGSAPTTVLPIGIPAYHEVLPSYDPSLQIPPTPPPIASGCKNNDDCSHDTTCINRLCIDMCYNGLCGHQAGCNIVSHRPQCRCPPGTTGNPNIKCSAIATEKPPIIQSPLTEQNLIAKDPSIIPEMGITFSPPDPITSMPSKQSLDPIPDEPVPPPIVPPISLACENNDNCDMHNSCINMLCYDACGLGMCGKDADCTVINHRPVCLCPIGTTGDPQIQCTSFLSDLPTTYPFPLTEHTNIIDEIIHPTTGIPSLTPPPIAEPQTPRPDEPPVQQYEPIPIAPLIAVGCESNDECPFDNSCINKLCMDICYQGLCGENANCKTTSNRPICECPPGTTGNPTVSCLAMKTDTFTTLKPLVETIPFSADDPVIPFNIPKSTFAPPLADVPTTHPPPPSYDRPKIPSVIAPYVVACENVGDCPIDNSCINRQCYDVCILGICGLDADCAVVSHRPVCTCPPGTTGDPQNQCKASLTDRPEIKEPIRDEIPQVPGSIISPLQEPNFVPPSAIGVPSYHIEDPSVYDPPVPPTPPSIQIGCKNNDQCNYDMTCVNALCMDICYPGLCGQHADCVTAGHKPLCSCPPGTTGNPTMKCSAIATERPIPLLPPIGEDPSVIQSHPIQPNFEEPSTTAKPIGITTQPYYDPPIIIEQPQPILIQTQIACENNDDCNIDNSCINMMCIASCSLGVCGKDADCIPNAHRPICICPPGTTGDSRIKCVALASDTLTILSPTAEHTTLSVQIINPIQGPLSDPPQPLAEIPTTTPEPIVHIPAQAPRPPPISVGCTSNTHCPYDNSCINTLCMDICHQELCGDNAQCSTKENRPTCVCPPGTTGNPTVKCTALNTETLDILPPIVDHIPMDSGKPIEPNYIPASSTQSPTFIPARPYPADPEIPRPIPPPIVPPVIIACKNNDDCSVDNSCINKLCIDVCSLGMCKEDVSCSVLNHRPICSCPPGTTGNAQYECKGIQTEKPELYDPVEEKHPIPFDSPIIPLRVPSPTSPSPIGLPQTPRPSDPLISFPAQIPTPPPIPVGCESNVDCKYDMTCVNKLCMNMCYQGLCGESADCITAGNRPICKCPPGTTGNPTIKCSALATERPFSQPPAVPFDVPTLPGDPIVPIAQPPHSTPSPTYVTPTSTLEPSIVIPLSPPIIPSTIIACQNNDNCDTDNSCINKICLDACVLGVCGEDAQCIKINHRPVCTCPLGTTGDPQIKCVSTTTEIFTLSPPIVQYPTVPTNVLIHSLAGPTTQRPPPSGIDSYPPADEPVYDPPSPAPLAPLITVGCTSNTQCPFDNSCINRLCMNVCHPGLCGEHADCKTQSNRPTCVCPSGTTGNPTIKCTSLSFLDITTQSAIADIPLHDPETQINPLQTAQTSTKSPTYIEPTPYPVDPEVPRPIPQPIVPLYAVACENSDDCSTDNSCINRYCYDVCGLGICGEDADCAVENHRPICICPSGTTGNPLHECKAITTDRPIIYDPIGHSAPAPAVEQIIPLEGPRTTLPPPLGIPPSTPTAEPAVKQPPDVPTPPPIPVGCESNYNCKYDMTCVNNLCMNICYQGLCGDTADCKTAGNRPICTCPPGTTGNPTMKCSALATQKPPIEKPPTYDDPYISPGDPIAPVASPVSTTPTPTFVTTPYPTEPLVVIPPSPPIIPSIIVACKNNDDCDADNSCINSMCLDACILGVCGTDANCIQINHRPVCSCPLGTTGDPQIKCIAITTDKTIVLPPIGEPAVVMPSDPIYPLPGAPSEMPPPSAIQPSPLPSDPVMSPPIILPTPPPITIGCKSNTECPFDNSCVNKLCMNICYQELCGENADCVTKANRPVCTCPPGTTGNPTVVCSAILIDSHTTLGPIADFIPFDPDNPIIPNHDPSPTQYPPTAIHPTPYPQDPEIPRPRPPPILPQVIVACENNDNCEVDNNCLNKLCYDVCTLGICGDDARCAVQNHRPVCTCPPGTTGNPLQECKAMSTDIPIIFEPIGQHDPPPPIEQIIPLSGPTTTTLPPLGIPPPIPHADPTIAQPPLVPVPPAIPVGCESNYNCNYDMTCVNKLCMNICYQGLCGQSAECQTAGNRPICTCPPGTTGNPTIKCSAVATERPPMQQPPTHIDPVLSPGEPISPVAQPILPLPSPTISTTQSPIEPPIIIPQAPPIVPPIIVACVNNDECDIDNSCINSMCINACQLGICGEDSTCIHRDHRPICVCPPGTSGNPQIKCTATTTEIYDIPPPFADEGIPPKDEPIYPLFAPSSELPPPFAIKPSPPPADPPVPPPPQVPRPPIIPVGCESNDDCSYDNSCVNKLCMDICHQGFCGQSADCQTKDNRPTCICPPGTTGNPTIGCTSLLTEIPPLQQPPLDEHFPPSPDKPIIAGHGPTATFPPPHGEISDAIPPEPPVPRPPPPPVVAPYIIACENNDDCTADNSCINNLCYDVCSLGVCGSNAECVITTHRPICTCPPGTTGDPQYECTAILTEKPIIAYPVTEIAPKQPAEEIIAGHDPPFSTQSPLGVPPTLKPSDPAVPLVPNPPTPSPIAVGCEQNNECSYGTTCINSLCMDICFQGLCGESADCITMSHRPLCNCPPGTTGNPTIKCSAMATERPVNYPPEGETTSRPPLETIYPISPKPVPVQPPLSDITIRPPHPPVVIPQPPPIIPAYNIACENNDGCDTDNACINRLCYETCALGVCGEDAECISGNHRPVCLCPPGTTGNPQIKCVSIQTDRPPSLQPPLADVPSMQDESIVAAHGPSSEIPPPLTVRPIDPPSDPSMKPPIIPPTSSPISIGCENSDNCAYDNSCINKICMDICHPGFCGENADCQTKRNRPVCSCPPGTTGNPTLKCISILIDSHTTLGPITQPITLPPSDPIISGKEPTPTTPPPLSQQPTPYPEEPQEDRPLPPPILPLIIIACENNDECSIDHSCLNHICYDVCSLGLCGDDADCVVDNHRPVCICPPGTTGHPLHKCTALLFETHTILSPVADDVPELIKEQIIPSYDPVAPQSPPIGIPPTERPQDPPVPRPPVPPTPAAIPIGCESNDECSYDTTCVNKLCMDMCYQGLCGPSASCSTVGHRPSCSCPPGTSGNPTIKCSALLVDILQTMPPLSDIPTPIPSDSIQPYPELSTLPPPISGIPTTRPPDIIFVPPIPPAIVPSLPVACKNNDDCDIDSSCINLLCYSACSLGICSAAADCSILDHRPVCVCPPGTTGDPQRHCSALSTERPTTFLPIGMTTSMPPPVIFTPTADEPSTNPPASFITTTVTAAPEFSQPSFVPTPPPYSISCKANDQCPYDNTCVNKLCLEICHPGLCGENANCRTMGHRPSCNCPPGTSGNPTIKCSAITTDKPTTLGPIDEYLASSPGTPILPTFETSTHPKPITDITIIKDEPRPPVPLPPMILPTVILACKNTDNCPMDNSCLNHICYDACALGICGVSSDCKISNHRPVCTCPPGTTGDPTKECTAMLFDEHTTKHPIGESRPPLIPAEITPSFDPVSTPAPPIIIVPTTTQDLIYVTPPPPPTPPSVTIGCESNDACPFDNTCVNRLCVDVCHQGLCGDNANCQTIEHRPFCVCPPGTTGNPTLKCSAMAVLDPILPKPPVGEISSIKEETIVSGVASESPIQPTADRPTPRPTEPTVPIRPTLPPLTSITIACSNNDDCSQDNSCINMFCYEVCTLGICGDDADCKYHRHRPVCTCPPGTTGNPQISCTSMTTEIHDAKPPIIFIPAPEPKEPIYPVSDSTTVLPPITYQTVPSITPTPPTLILPPTARPLPVGCSRATDCKFDEKCINKLCSKTCSVTPCTEGNECRAVSDHSAVCTPIPPIGVINECSKDPDCFNHQVCIDTGCRDVCLVNNPCAPNAICKGEDHRPLCNCPPGYIGNPHISCKLPELPTTPRPHDPVKPIPECLIDEDCDLSLACIDGTCRDACIYRRNCGFNADCLVTVHTPHCVCQAGFTGNPFVHCYPPSEPKRPTPMVEPQCFVNEDCPLDRACFEGNCRNPCIVANRCAANALCDVEKHRTVCSCPPGLTGDPFIKCSESKISRHHLTVS